jgi:hypothetical protein
MNKLILTLLFIFLPSSALTQTKWTAQTENTAILGTDLLLIVDDPGGTPLSQKITATNLFDIIDTFAELDSICADKELVNADDGEVWSGVHDYGSATSFEIVNTADCSGVTGEGLMCWDSDDDLLYVGDGAAAGVVGHGNGANCAAGEIPLGVDSSGAVEGCYEPTLNDVEDPTASKTFGMGTSSLIFNFANTTGDHAFELNAIGNFSKDLLHVHQHTGNPTAGSVTVFEWEDVDVDPVTINVNSPGAASGTDEVGLLITTDDDDDTDYVPLRIADDSGGNDDTLYLTNSLGTFFVLDGFDGVGAVDLDYGSADITDHTFTTDGTGTAEIVLPAGSIDGTEILDDTVDSPEYAANSIDDEHLATTECWDLRIHSAKLTGDRVTDGDATQGGQIDAGEGGWRGLLDATTDEAFVWQRRLPSYWGAHAGLIINYSMVSATANEVEFEGAIDCKSDGDAVATVSFSTIAVASATVPGTAGLQDTLTITLTDDSCASGDTIYFYLSTDADDGTNNDATGDREVHTVQYCFTR